MIIYPFKKNLFLSIISIYLSITLTPLAAFEVREYLLIDKLVKSCYKDTKFCNDALFKIHNYQKRAATNNKLSCQTRLLGLEANLIMAMNFTLNRKEAESIIQAVKRYC